MRFLMVMLPLLVLPIAATDAEVHIGISIGLNISTYPELVRVPGYPVYYDPYAGANYFFYDGLYWVYEQDNWYSSNWYNGPWNLVDAEYVPLYVLRVPVRYYRQPPVYFNGWRADAAPHWGEHWGQDWEAHRKGWDHWDHQFTPRPAPLPEYQRQYSGDSYPQATQQRSIRTENYHFKSREPIAQHIQQRNNPPRPQPDFHRQAVVAQPLTHASVEQRQLPQAHQGAQPLQRAPSPPNHAEQRTQPARPMHPMPESRTDQHEGTRDSRNLQPRGNEEREHEPGNHGEDHH